MEGKGSERAERGKTEALKPNEASLRQARPLPSRTLLARGYGTLLLHLSHFSPQNSQLPRPSRSSLPFILTTRHDSLSPSAHRLAGVGQDRQLAVTITV